MLFLLHIHEELIYLEVIILLMKRSWHKDSSMCGILIEEMHSPTKSWKLRTVLLCELCVYIVYILILLKL